LNEDASVHPAVIAGLDAKVAVITGGASGIGQACAALLRASGAAAVVADLEGDPPVDVTDRASLEALRDRVAGEHGRLDALLNCAGIVGVNRPAAEVTQEEFDAILAINLRGTFAACQVMHPMLARSRGAIVNVASQAALVSLPNQAAYSATKGGVAALTRSLAIDWAADGIRVNAVAPGFVVTPMTAAFRELEGLVAAAERRTPIGRLLEAEEIAAVMVFLASPLASAVTGVLLPIDGGWTAGEPELPW
jgi:meso-butanediol dehydrogenase / (S,S)-butanediol dehydrogenase / diacetyl reductase